MNILLTTAKAPANIFFPTNEKLFPLGIGYLTSKLRQAKHHVHYLDPYFDPSEIYDSDFLNRNKIDVVGIYACTICLKDVVHQIKSLREFKWKGKVIVGGPHCSVGDMNPYMDYIDHAVNGEAEDIIVDLVEGNVRDYLLKTEPIADLDSLPRAAFDLIGNREYISHERSARLPIFNLNTSRGCPYNCSFCSSGPVSGRKYRFQSAERIIDDIKYLKSEYNVGSIYFRENNFCVSRERTTDFCELVLQEDIDLEWRCEASVKDLPRETLKLMKRAGCKGLFIGFETGSASLLKKLKPGFSIEENIKVANDCRELGIQMHASFLVGTPYESEADIQETLNFSDKYIPGGQSCINVYIGLQGSKIYNELNESSNYQYKDKLGLIYTKKHDDYVRRFNRVTKPTHNLLIPKPEFDAKIAVLMSIYNGENFLRESIDSVLDQTFKDFVFLVVDDGSTDRTLKILQSYVDPRLHIFINAKHENRPQNLNYLLDYINQECPNIKYIARQDADDISHPERFSKQVVFLDKNPACAVLGTYFKVFSKNSAVINTISYIPCESEEVKSMLPFYNVICHGSAMIRRDCLEEVGYYNPKLQQFEDYELWMRIATRYEIRNLPKFLYSLRYKISNPREKNFIEKARQNFICKTIETKPLDDMKIQHMQLSFGSIYPEELDWRYIFIRLNMIHERLIREIVSKRIVIYGAGTTARYLFPMLAKRNEIVAVVDINKGLHNTNFDSCGKIYPPEYLNSIDYDVIIVTPLNRKYDISNFLGGLLDEAMLLKVIYLDDILVETYD